MDLGLLVAALPVLGGLGLGAVKLIQAPLHKRIDLHLQEDELVHAQQKESLDRIERGVNRLTEHILDG